MKRYAGTRTPNGCEVNVIDGGESYPLDPRFDLPNHSRSGFEMGYAGSGPAQLSLALLADAVVHAPAQPVPLDRFTRHVGRR